MADKLPTERFTSRVADYVRYRPGYPDAIVPLLQREIGLAADWRIVDVGSGPGNLTRLFLDHGFRVIGVEPNDAMRAAGEELMAGDPCFQSVDGTAEHTSLAPDSAEFVTAGQAFHWFEPVETRKEFLRILTKPRWVALIWNKRPEGSAPILDAWSDMIRAYSTEYDAVRLRDEAAIEGMSVLFGDSGYRTFTLPNEQLLNAESFWGRLISSSYTPQAGEPGHLEIMTRNSEIFEEYAVDGVLRFPYETQILVGELVP